MTQALVTIVIPTYNYGRLVSMAVESALHQNYSPIEIIVVDDGSTDDTSERLTPYGDRIRVIRQENQGLSAARNTGIRASRGEFVALLDSDDAFHPQKISRQLAVFAACPDLSIVGTAVFSTDTPIWSEIPDGPPTITFPTFDQLVIATSFAPSSAMIRRRCLDEVGLFDTKLRAVEDRDMWIRLGARHRVGVIHEPLTWYRITPGSMSQNPERMEINERKVYLKAFSMPELNHRWVFQRRVLARSALTSAYCYGENGKYGIALRRIASSLTWWPLPFPRHEVKAIFARPRFAFACLRKMISSRS